MRVWIRNFYGEKEICFTWGKEADNRDGRKADKKQRKENFYMKKLEGYMKGVNLGGWLSQYNDTTKEYYDTYIVEDDIDRI